MLLVLGVVWWLVTGEPAVAAPVVVATRPVASPVASAPLAAAPPARQLLVEDEASERQRLRAQWLLGSTFVLTGRFVVPGEDIAFVRATSNEGHVGDKDVEVAADGRFRVELSPDAAAEAGGFELRLLDAAGGCWRAVGRGDEKLWPGTMDLGDVVVQSVADCCVGLVVDAEARPVAGAEVDLGITGAGQETVRRLETGADGSFLFAGLPSTSLRLTVSACGCITKELTCLRPQCGLIVRLQREPWYRGRVMLPEGWPHEALQVVFGRDELVFEAHCACAVCPDGWFAVPAASASNAMRLEYRGGVTLLRLERDGELAWRDDPRLQALMPDPSLRLVTITLRDQFGGVPSGAFYCRRMGIGVREVPIGNDGTFRLVMPETWALLGSVSGYEKIELPPPVVDQAVWLKGGHRLAIGLDLASARGLPTGYQLTVSSGESPRNELLLRQDRDAEVLLVRGGNRAITCQLRHVALDRTEESYFVPCTPSSIDVRNDAAATRVELHLDFAHMRQD